MNATQEKEGRDAREREHLNGICGGGDDVAAVQRREVRRRRRRRAAQGESPGEGKEKGGRVRVNKLPSFLSLSGRILLQGGLLHSRSLNT